MQAACLHDLSHCQTQNNLTHSLSPSLNLRLHFHQQVHVPCSISLARSLSFVFERLSCNALGENRM